MLCAVGKAADVANIWLLTLTFVACAVRGQSTAAAAAAARCKLCPLSASCLHHRFLLHVMLPCTMLVAFAEVSWFARDESANAGYLVEIGKTGEGCSRIEVWGKGRTVRIICT